MIKDDGEIQTATGGNAAVYYNQLIVVFSTIDNLFFLIVTKYKTSACFSHDWEI